MQRPALLFSYATALAFIVASVLLQGIQAVNVLLPNDFVQCGPASIEIGDSQGNVSILIREEGVKKAIVNVSLALNTTSWNWTAVTIPEGANFTILVTDRSPKKKTKLSQSFTQSIVDPSPTNDTSCLPPQDRKKGKGVPADSPANGNDDSNDGIGGGSHHTPHKINTAEVSIIAGVLGGLLLALLLLILLMCWRRRRESRLHDNSENNSKDTVLAHRIGVMGQRIDRHQVVTLFGEDGREEGQAILGREGDAGWSYMSRIVPGLQTTPFIADTDDPRFGQSPGRTGRRLKTKRYDNESKDGELPSYGVSEYEKKALPRYAEDHRTNSTYNAAMILTTRHGSQGSRLTFQPELLDPNGIETTPRHSARSLGAVSSNSNADDGEVIVFRPASEQDAMLPYGGMEGDRTSLYSNASPERGNNQAATTALQPSWNNITPPAEGNTFHRRSRSEVSLRRPTSLSNEPLYR
jgi:hypothetical protein